MNHSLPLPGSVNCVSVVCFVLILVHDSTMLCSPGWLKMHSTRFEPDWPRAPCSSLQCRWLLLSLTLVPPHPAVLALGSCPSFIGYSFWEHECQSVCLWDLALGSLCALWDVCMSTDLTPPTSGLSLSIVHIEIASFLFGV